MNKRTLNKERERRFVELLKASYSDFPAGDIIADENQERPDIVVVTPQGKLGIEVTALHIDRLKRSESESEKVVTEARLIYEKSSLPNLRVSVHVGNSSTFTRKTRAGDLKCVWQALQHTHGRRKVTFK